MFTENGGCYLELVAGVDAAFDTYKTGSSDVAEKSEKNQESICQNRRSFKNVLVAKQNVSGKRH